MTNAEKYLGESKLAADYKGSFFSDENMNSLKIRVEKILEDTDEEIAFITSEECDGERFFFVKFLTRLSEKPHIFWRKDKFFSTLDDAIEYYKKSLNEFFL
jgi:hypothetical protein